VLGVHTHTHFVHSYMYFNIYLCIQTIVARGVQLPTLGLVAAALGGLVVYDTVSVYGTGALVAPAAAAEGMYCILCIYIRIYV